jgi:alpha/beta superfamily hydrolase
LSESFSLDPHQLSREETIIFSGPAGRLEGRWRPAMASVQTRGAVVVAHPHPAHGGSLQSKVVFHLARVLNHDLGCASLRFNFRGVGTSEGEYDEGRGEAADVEAAWAEARRRVPDKPLIGAGFSFGAAMTLFATAAQDPVAGKLPRALAVIGIPLKLFSLPSPFPAAVPIAAVHGGNDEYTPPDAVRRYLSVWPAPTALHVEDGAGHFLEERISQATSYLSEHLDLWL